MSTGIKLRQRYPWVTAFSAILLLAYFYLHTQSDLQQAYHIPPEIFATPIPEVLLLVFSVLLLLELRLFSSRRQQQQHSLQQLKSQLNELLDNKKQLNAKAHIYAGHADKLKLFISDKLLEFIEYDEKFLHFKSIASEVRHNGVISYDKVTTTLDAMLAVIDDPDSAEFANLVEARDSLQYLWDLLDLSTADNIALHIANQVCENEEKLFQLELNDSNTDFMEKPVFDPGRALTRALTRCFGSAPLYIDNDGIQIPEQPQVWIRCQQTAPLLGNENHIVLALENLINNAQYFAGRQPGRRREKSARIAIEVKPLDHYTQYIIYNRGASINETTAKQIFQLGYSTRRAKEHHGKGLGLYFVNEIVKGYDGNISFRNIDNHTDVLSLRMEMHSGEVITEVIELLNEDGVMRCRKSGSESTDTLHWELYGELRSLEMTHQSDQQTHRLDTINDNLELSDPSSERYPRWQLSVGRPQAESTYLQFTPINIAGVEFTLQLPTLTARLEGDLLSINEEAMEQQVAELTQQFKTLEE